MNPGEHGAKRIVDFPEHFLAAGDANAPAISPDLEADDFDVLAIGEPQEEKPTGRKAFEQALMNSAEGSHLQINSTGLIDRGELVLIVGDAAREFCELGTVFPALSVEVKVDASLGNPLQRLMAIQRIVHAEREEIQQALDVSLGAMVGQSRSNHRTQYPIGCDRAIGVVDGSQALENPVQQSPRGWIAGAIHFRANDFVGGHAGVADEGNVAGEAIDFRLRERPHGAKRDSFTPTIAGMNRDAG